MRKRGVISERVYSIVGALNLDDKVGQLLQLDASATLLNDNCPGYGGIQCLNMTKLTSIVKNYKIGSLFNNMMTPQEWIPYITAIQKTNLDLNKIPILYGIDSVHGANYAWGATLFPQHVSSLLSLSLARLLYFSPPSSSNQLFKYLAPHPNVIISEKIAAGATFNDDLMFDEGFITAKDTRTSGMLWAFTPHLEITANPLWPRSYET